jgi:hypothetical protein
MALNPALKKLIDEGIREREADLVFAREQVDIIHDATRIAAEMYPERAREFAFASGFAQGSILGEEEEEEAA